MTTAAAPPMDLVRMVTHPMSARFPMRGRLRHLGTTGFRVTLISPAGVYLERTADREGVA